jgi:hypothetical protein
LDCLNAIGIKELCSLCQTWQASDLLLIGYDLKLEKVALSILLKYSEDSTLELRHSHLDYSYLYAFSYHYYFEAKVVRDLVKSSP